MIFICVVFVGFCLFVFSLFFFSFIYSPSTLRGSFFCDVQTFQKTFFLCTSVIILYYLVFYFIGFFAGFCN